jgi:hypothetical protein
MSVNMFRNKLALSRIVAALLFLNLSSGAAQAWDSWGSRESLRNEVRRFHAFLQDHPKVSSQLRANPHLVGNRRYLDKHEELDVFLRRHPAVRREILDHPERVFGRNYLADDYGPWRRR